MSDRAEARPIPTLMITSVGSLSGHGALGALAAVRDRIRVIGTNATAAAAAPYACDAAYLVPSTAERDAYLDAHARIVLEERVDLVLPSRDEELAVLPDMLDRLPADRRPLYVGSTAAVGRIVLDKYETAAFARRHGLPFAATAFGPEETEALLRTHGLPLIGKPRRGFASLEVFVARTAGEARAVAALGTHILQEHLAPPPNLDARSETCRIALPLFHAPIDRTTAVMALSGPDGRVAGCFAVAVTLDAGRVVGVRREAAPSVSAVARAWAEALGPHGYAGPLNVQGVLRPDGRYVPFELNARIAGGSPGRALLGFNDVILLLNAWLPPGRRLPVAESGPPGRVVTIARPRRIAAAARARLEADREWRVAAGDP